MAVEFNPGDRVAYSAAFLKSTQMHECGGWRGTVRAVESFDRLQLVTIAWDHGPVLSHYHADGLGRVLSTNLTLESRIAIDAARAG